jgi:hypothetical protein
MTGACPDAPPRGRPRLGPSLAGARPSGAPKVGITPTSTFAVRPLPAHRSLRVDLRRPPRSTDAAIDLRSFLFPATAWRSNTSHQLRWSTFSAAATRSIIERLGVFTPRSRLPINGSLESQRSEVPAADRRDAALARDAGGHAPRAPSADRTPASLHPAA